MRNITKRIAVAFISTVMTASTFLPSQAAMPVIEKPSAPVVSDVTQAQYWDRRYGRPDMERRYGRPDWNGRPGWDARRDDRDGWYRGHRGYRDYRPGYRQYNGYWFPLAAFATGAIIGGALSQPSRPIVRDGGINPRHVSWCSNRYRSYRAYDNTFQPNRGGRQQCMSPYY